MAENKLFREISSLLTEQKNENTRNIDLASTVEILEMINTEDMRVPFAVRKEIPNIALAVDTVTDAFNKGGRLFYFGAGTSGRLGIVDASECPPTYGTPPEMVQGVIAGGNAAMFRAQEGAEDLPENGANELIKRDVNPPDIVCGIAASGRTPFVKGALNEAKKRGITTIIISTSNRSKLKELGIDADIYITPIVGPEVIAGSTRMKSGTAQKLVLNMITTASMVRLGKTYENVMVDLELTNAKLQERAKRILMEITGVNYDEASDYLDRSSGHVKTAIVMILSGADKEKAKEMLENAGGFIRKAVKL